MKRQQHIHRAITETLEARTLLADAGFVKDILPGPDSGVFFSNTDATDHATNKNKIYFTAIDPVLGQQPYVSDGTANGTKRVRSTGINTTGDTFVGDYVASIGSARGLVYFAANDGTGWDVWVTDGTDENTAKLTNLGGLTGSTGINYLTDAGSEVFFTADGKLYTTSFTDGGQKLITSAAVPLPNQLSIGNTHYFEAEDATNGGELWACTDQATAHLVANINPGDADSAITHLTSFNNKLFFTAYNGSGGNHLYSSDGSGASLVGGAMAANASPSALTVSGGKLYFRANTDSGYQIWRSDGNTKSAISSLTGTSAFDSIRDLTDVNGTLFFTYAPNGSNRLLYKLVGDTPTRVGTATGGIAGGTSPGFLTAVGGNVYFSGLDTNAAAKLFKSDGSAITLVPGDIGSDPNGLVNVEGKLFFRANDASRGDELRKLDDAGGGVVEPPPTEEFKLRVKIHKNAKGHTKVIDEGESLTFEAIPTGGEIEKIYWDFGDGKLTYLGKSRKPTHEYTDNFATPTVNVRAKVKRFGDKKFYNVEGPITVNNVAPTNLKITMMSAFVTMAPMPYFGSVTDPADNKNGKMKVTINWDDGETTELIPRSDGYFAGVKVWSQRQLLGRDVRVTANDGTAPSITKKHKVHVDWVTDTTLDAASGRLGLLGTYIGATDGNDRIAIKKSPSHAEELLVQLNAQAGITIMFHSATTLNLFGGGGNDRIEIDTGVNVRGKMYGGSGKDTLRGGDGRDTLYGQGGSDSLDGRGGKNTVKQ